MGNSGKAELPVLNLNTAAIMLRADASDEMLTYQSSVSGISYIIDRNGGVMILEKHGYYRAQWEELQVICEELSGWILREAERWARS